MSSLINIKDNHIAIDGKASRGSRNKSGKMLHLLNAYLSDDCSFLGQEKTAQKSNEITAIPKLLKALDLEAAFVNIDAMGRQKEIATQIVKHQGDYLRAVKDSQKTLYKDIKSAFRV